MATRTISDFLENAWINHALKQTAYTKPGALHLALSTVLIGEDGSGLAEPLGNNYSRVTLTPGSTYWESLSARQVSNKTLLTYPIASGSWGDIGYWGIYDAPTGGNLIAYGDLASVKTINTDQTLRIAAGQIVISVPATNGIGTYLADQLLGHTFLDVTYTQETNLYVGLATGSIPDAGTWTAECANSGAYARVNVNGWTVINNAADNTGAINFTTATGAWGLVTNHFISNNAGRGLGDLLFTGALNTSFSPVDQDEVIYNAGAFDISLD